MSIDGLGAVILCGGRSRRMGFPKHELWFDGKTFLESVVERVSEVAYPVVVVVGHAESPPAVLPDNVKLLCDERPDLGPLEGIRTGLASLEDRVSHAFVTSCDAPNLRPQLIRRLFDLMGQHDAVVPIDGDRIYGMTAIYRTLVCEKIESIYASGVSRRVSALQAAVNARLVSLDELKEVDPNLESFNNINTADAYFDFLKRHGATCPSELAARLG
jgi:molybdopterin-guanine dinucleotide biosynthesis protein A